MFICVKFRYFAMFFLNGEIFPNLKANVKMLRSSPKNLIKQWAQNTPHILTFVNTLIRRHVNSKQKILDVWKKDQFCMWILPTFIFVFFSSNEYLVLV